jgi:glutaredoxin-like YruB-family protein
MSITIYTTPTCRFCAAAKAFFKENDVAYEEKDVTVDAEARTAMIQKSGQLGVPVIDINGQIVVGFNEQRLAELVAEAK